MVMVSAETAGVGSSAVPQGFQGEVEERHQGSSWQEQGTSVPKSSDYVTSNSPTLYNNYYCMYHKF